MFSGDVFLSFGISASFSSIFKCNSFECNFFGDFETIVILSAILLPIKPTVASTVYLIPLFEAVFVASVVEFISLSRIFWLYSLLEFLPMFLAKDKIPYPFTYILALGSVEYLIPIMVVLFTY